MAQITIDIPTVADLNRAVDAICLRFNYRATIVTVNGETPNPETRNQFAKRMVANWIKSVIADFDADQAATTARASASNLNIT